MKSSLLRAAFIATLCIAAMLAFAPSARAGVAPQPLTANAADGAQRSYAAEWWRLTGHLQTPDGHRFAIAATFFRYDLPRSRDASQIVEPGAARTGGMWRLDAEPRRGGSGERASGDFPTMGKSPAVPPGLAAPGSTIGRDLSRWRGGEFFPATFALVDETRQRYRSATRSVRGALGVGRAAAGRLAVAAGRWTLRAVAGAKPAFALHVDDDGLDVDVTQVAMKPRVAFGEDGVVRSGSCADCVEHAFAYTRLKAKGSLSIDGVRYQVTGTTWLDHEFGEHIFGAGDAGWDRFALQLDDGRDVLVRTVWDRHGQPSASGGALVARDGRVTNLGAGDAFVSLVARTKWRSPATRVNYPVLWELVVPEAGLDLAVVPAMRAQEIVSEQGGPAYYEGSVDVERAPPPGGDPGRGFVEMTGRRSSAAVR